MDFIKCDIFPLSFIQSFIIAAPQVGTTVEVAPTDPLNTFGASIGDCTTDTFVVSSPGRVGTPVICGDNSGQHSEGEMISYIN